MTKLLNLHILEEIGLTKNEALIYYESLRMGPSLAKAITRATNMHRTTVYSCLQRLHKKGLVSISVVDEKTYFKAANPKKLMALVKERETQLQAIMPELSELSKSKLHTEHDVVYYKGKQGLKTVFNDMLTTAKEYVGWGPADRLEALLKHYFIYYIKERIKRKINIKLIYPYKSRERIYTKNPMLEIRFLKHSLDMPTAHRIYKDKVAILLLEEEPLSIIIKNKQIADSYRNHFNELWANAETILDTGDKHP